MKLEEQVVSLELAKRLKELGVRQESAFVWAVQDDEAELIQDDGTLDDADNIEDYAAFTVAELGEMLPQMYQSWRGPIGWFCSNRNGEGIGPIVTGNIEADARAKCLVYLIENNLIPTPPRSE